jgi:hypothetical protein
MIRRTHEMRFAVVRHPGWTQRHPPAVAGQQLTILADGPDLPMLLKMSFGVSASMRDHTAWA